MPTDPYSVLSRQTDTLDDETAMIAAGLRRLWAMVVQGMRHGESLSGLHLQQFWVLILTRKTPMRMSEIAQALETSQANVTGLVDRLERDGYVSRVRAESDRRVVEVGITQEGLGDGRGAWAPGTGSAWSTCCGTSTTPSAASCSSSSPRPWTGTRPSSLSKRSFLPPRVPAVQCSAAPGTSRRGVGLSRTQLCR